MIYTDGVHLISDKSLDELHEFAKSIGLKRHWFHNGRHPHYDLPKRKRLNLLIGMQYCNAVIVSRRELVKASLNAEWRK